MTGLATFFLQHRMTEQGEKRDCALHAVRAKSGTVELTLIHPNSARDCAIFIDRQSQDELALWLLRDNRDEEG